MKDTLITYVDEDGRKAARSLWGRYADISDMVPINSLKWRSNFVGMLIVIGHGRTMVDMGRYIGLDNVLGDFGGSFIVLAACEVGMVHESIGELQSIAQGLANTRKNCFVWGTVRDLPKQSVADGTCFYKSPLFNWLQPANDNFPGLWIRYEKQSDDEQAISMLSKLKLPES